MDSRDILTIKGLIRRGEARTACTYNNIPLERCHFLDLPFYETGKIQKNPISEADVEIVRNLLREIKPHQIFGTLEKTPESPFCRKYQLVKECFMPELCTCLKNFFKSVRRL